MHFVLIVFSKSDHGIVDCIFICRMCFCDLVERKFGIWNLVIYSFCCYHPITLDDFSVRGVKQVE